MNSTMFSVKRAFLRTVNFGRKVLEPFELTPARFDAMFLLRGNPYRPQADLWKVLGLHPSTVSKLLKRLEELNLVWRGPDPDDGRRVLCSLSWNGEKALEAAIAELVANGALDAFVADAVAGPHRRACKRDVAVLNLEEALLRVRRTFLDSARLLYVFDPEAWGEDARRPVPEWPHLRSPFAQRDRWGMLAES